MKKGSSKPPVNALPAAGRIHGAIAAHWGNLNHGFYDFRDGRPRLMTMLDAIERHVLCILDGEDIAQDSECTHFGHIIADSAIALDGMENGNLIDDRPTKGNASRLLIKPWRDKI